jgi:hypothetical protein
MIFRYRCWRAGVMRASILTICTVSRKRRGAEALPDAMQTAPLSLAATATEGFNKSRTVFCR